ncbi:hypothetical protein QMK47_10810 [Pseudomonas sp. P9_35]|nr:MULTISPECIES: hypothetical protein [Pseudomonas]WPN66423.1 hypothetical protein QMK48_09900 [Pseudomonas sp. P9_32]WPN72005.1 hypothetical protein QMK47_10810 [Pseudomonas sp. P9_35]
MAITEETDIHPKPKTQAKKNDASPFLKEAPFFLTEQHHNQV